MVVIKVLNQITSLSNCERNWKTFSFIHMRPRNRLTMQKLNKLVHISSSWVGIWRRRTFEDWNNCFCPINLDYIFSETYAMLGEWLEEVEKLLLDKDPD